MMQSCAASTAIVPHATSTQQQRVAAKPGAVVERATTSNPYGSVATTQQGLHMSAFNLDEKSLKKFEAEWTKWCGKDSGRTCCAFSAELSCIVSNVRS